MSFLLNPFLSERRSIVSVENAVMLTVANGTVAGSLVFQATIKAKLASGFHAQVPVSYDTTGYNGSVDGFYTLTGTLTPTAPVTNPLGLTVSIVVWVIPVGYVWIDCIDKNQVVGAIDNIARITTQITGKTGTSMIQKNALLLQRPSWNGEGSYFNTQSAMLQAGATSAFTRFTNGGQFTIYIIWKQLAIPTTHLGPLFDDTNGSTTNIGMSLFVDNRAGSSRDNNINFLICKGVAGQPPINLVSSNDAVVQDAWNCCKLTYDGTTVRVYTSASGGAFSQVASGTPAFAFSASNHTNLLTFGNLFTVGASTGIKGYYKHAYFEDSFMSAPDQANLDAWAQAMCTENLIVTDANVYAMVTQSNCSGRALNSSIDADLTGRVGAFIMSPQPTPATQTPGTGTINSDSYWGELELGINQTTESVATQHGAEMRFGYEMHQFNENCYIIKYGVGGTPFANQGVYNDWNIAATATLYTQFFGLLGTGFDEIQHVFRRNPIWRGLDIMGGETDAIITGAGALFHGNVCGTVNGWIDAMVGLGYTINKLRIFIWQITDVGGAAYDPTEFAAVKAAQTNFPTQYYIDFPSRIANVKGIVTRTTDDLPLLDLQHYNHVGQDMRGTFMFDNFKIWTAE